MNIWRYLRSHLFHVRNYIYQWSNLDLESATCLLEMREPFDSGAFPPGDQHPPGYQQCWREPWGERIVNMFIWYQPTWWLLKFLSLAKILNAVPSFVFLVSLVSASLSMSGGSMPGFCVFCSSSTVLHCHNVRFDFFNFNYFHFLMLHVD